MIVRSPISDYVITIVALMAAVLLRWVLDPWLGDHLALATLYGAVALSVWVGGYRPATLAAVLGFLACDLLFIPPRGQFGPISARDFIGLTAYLISCSAIIAIGEAMRAARRRAQASFEHLQQEAAQRQKAEETLRLRNEEVERLLESLPAAVWVAHDPECRTVTGNLYAERLQAVEQGTNFSATLPGEERHWLRCVRNGREMSVEELPLQRTIAAGSGVENLEYDLELPGGQTINLLCNTVPLRDAEGRVRGAVAACLDISALRATEESYRGLFTSMQEGLLVAEMIEDRADGKIDFRYLDMNPAAERILGFSRDQVIGKTAREIIPNVREDLLRMFAEVARTGKPVQFEAFEPLVNQHHQSFGFRPAPGQVAVLFWDITERKRAEKALRESEERLRLATSAGSVGVWDWDIVSNTVSWSNSLYAIHGIEPGEFDGTVEAFAALVHPDDRAFVTDAIRRALQEGAPYELEFRAVRPDGSIIWISTQAQVMRDASGAPLRMLGGTVDITRRKQAELALREREERYELVVAGAEAAIWDWDVPAQRVVYSPRWKQMRGFADDEVSDREEEWSGGIHPEDRARALAAVQAHFAGQTPVFAEEYRVRHKDGHWIWILDRGIARRDASGQVVRMAGSETDITERKLAEEALRDSENRLAAELAVMTRMQQVSTRLVQADDFSALLHEILDAAIEITSADMGNIQLLEREALKIVAQRGFEAPFLNFFNSVHEGQAACGSAMQSGERVIVEDVANSPIFTGTPTLEVMFAAGALAVQSTPLVSRSGRLLGMFSTHYHAPHRPDERALRLLDVLARQAADLIERTQAEQALREADRRKDEFLATLAHELRNPLAPIRNAVQILHARGPLPPELQWARDVIDRQVDQMTRLVDDLLDVSRITRGKIELRKQPVELRAVVNDAVEASRPLIEQCGHTLSVELPPEPILLEADPMRLAQVLLNLLNNAAKYTDQGGRIRLTASREDGQVVVRVKDSGVGIPQNMLPTIFEMFTQVGRSLERSQGGLGIGLTLVRRLVAMHGGEVEARSDGQGKGSEFIVRLPAAEGVDRGAHQRAAGGELMPAAPPLRILVVDDNQDSADSLALFLSINGHEVRTAHDGLAAVEEAASFQPGVILLDIGLPKLNGYEAAQQIRRQRGAGVLLIALTGWGQEEDRRRSREAGFDHHLTKPVNFDKLNKLIATNTSTIA